MKDFLKKFNISEEDFAKTELKWSDLMGIRADYVSFIGQLEPPAKYLVDIFHKVAGVHSVRYRIKSPDKLIAKIIRKRIENPARIITIENYKSELTDLIGIRILHLFKEDWESIHNFIINNCDLHDPVPIAYYREGDSDENISSYERYKCVVQKHPYGYRSVHYLIITRPNKASYIAEIQVRTIFEEAWSEIDHIIRYPYNLDNLLLNQFLVLFNRLAGSADEMGSFVLRLKYQLARNEEIHQASMEKKIQLIEELKQEIRDLKLKPKQALNINSSLDEIFRISEPLSKEFNFSITKPQSGFDYFMNPDPNVARGILEAVKAFRGKNQDEDKTHNNGNNDTKDNL